MKNIASLLEVGGGADTCENMFPCSSTLFPGVRDGKAKSPENAGMNPVTPVAKV
jgi:hypothetical protein